MAVLIAVAEGDDGDLGVDCFEELLFGAVVGAVMVDVEDVSTVQLANVFDLRPSSAPSAARRRW